MSSDDRNPLNMVTDPLAGDLYVLQPIKCTDERRFFIRRFNEILAFLYISFSAFSDYRANFQSKVLPQLPAKTDSVLRFSLDSGESIITTPARIIESAKSGPDILTRQLFVMCYGSFETYLYQLFERSFPLIGVTEDIVNKSRDILMLRKWDGKFCRMSDVFGLGYRAGNLSAHFSDFEMDFGGTIHKNPLSFLDELAQVRHRIVHVSSILEKEKALFIGMGIFHPLLGFFLLLTDYVDCLFANKYGYERPMVNPGEA